MIRCCRQSFSLTNPHCHNSVRPVLLICLFVLMFSGLPAVSRSASLGVDQDALKQQLTEIAMEKIFSGLEGIPEEKLKDATYFNELVRDMAPLGVKLDETNFSTTALEIYNKYKEAVDSGKTPEQARENVKALVKGDLSAIIYNSLDEGSQEVIDNMSGLIEKANEELSALDKINEELAKDPDADYAELLKKYGLKGDSLEKFEALEKQLRGTYEKYGDHIEAARIIYSGMSGDAGDKIDALFDLGESFGGKVPVIGRFVELYFKVAKEMVAATGRLSKLLEAQQAGCVGEGTHGSKRTVKIAQNTRNVVFVETFGQGPWACPVGYGANFWQDVYEDAETSGQMYFWTGDGYIKGNAKGGGVDAVKALRTFLRENDEADKAEDINFIAECYNFTPGFLERKKLIEEMANDMIRKFSALDSGYCLENNEFNQLLIDKAGLQFLVDNSDGILEIKQGRRFMMGSWDVKYIVDKILLDRYVKRTGRFWSACEQTRKLLDNIIFVKIRGEVLLEAGDTLKEYPGVAIKAEPADRVLTKCSYLSTNINGIFEIQLVKEDGESFSLDLVADDGKNTPGKESVSVSGATPHYSVKIRIKGACPKGFKFDADGRCVPDCPPNHTLNTDGECVPKCRADQVRDADGRCVCRPGYEEVDGKCVDSQKKCGPNQVRNADGECVCKSGYEEIDGACVKIQKKCGPNEVLNADDDCVCKSGYEDIDGQCVKIQKKCGPNEVLNADDDCVCKSGYEDIDGQCVKIQKKCGPNEVLNADDDCVCKSGYEDIDGQCVKIQKKCGPNERLDADGQCVCRAGYKRDSNGNCTECQYDDECPLGYTCVRGKCVFQKADCRRDGCPSGYKCDAKTGNCVFIKSGCTDNRECKQGYVCVDGKCVSPFDEDYDNYTSDMGDREDDRSQDQADRTAADQGGKGGRSGYTADDLTQDMDAAQDDISGGRPDDKKKCDPPCPAGYVCKNGACVEKPVCNCKKGQVCVDGKCVDQPVQQAALAITPANKAVVINETVNLKAVFTDTDGSSKDVTAQASWSPSATFSKGTIGVYTVTASHKGLSATSQITVVKEKGMDDITVNEKTVTVTFWDHGQEDGDMIDILINGEVVFPGITLKNAHQSRTITMNADIIVVGFRALNEGRISPNTATVTFTSVTAGKPSQTYELKQNQEANMNMTYKP